MIRLDMLRHGETVLLEKKQAILRGRTDDALTALGWQQMQQAFEQQVKYTQWQAIATSTLQRCAQFAQQQSRYYQLPLIEVSNLQELDFGDWEGRSTAELFQQDPELLANYWRMPVQYTPPNAESVLQFEHRIRQALSEIYDYAICAQIQHICVITHGGVIKLMHCLAQQKSLNEILQMPADLAQFHSFYIDVLSNNLVIRCI